MIPFDAPRNTPCQLFRPVRELLVDLILTLAHPAGALGPGNAKKMKLDPETEMISLHESINLLHKEEKVVTLLAPQRLPPNATESTTAKIPPNLVGTTEPYHNISFVFKREILWARVSQASSSFHPTQSIPPFFYKF